jgi:hypothetical protein
MHLATLPDDKVVNVLSLDVERVLSVAVMCRVMKKVSEERWRWDLGPEFLARSTQVRTTRQKAIRW